MDPSVQRKNLLRSAAAAARKVFVDCEQRRKEDQEVSPDDSVSKNKRHRKRLRAETGGTEISTAHVKIGDPIFVMWTDGLSYPATVIGLSEDGSARREIKYRWIDPKGYAETGFAQLKAVKTRKVGSIGYLYDGCRVMAQWSEDRMWYPARVRNKTTDSVTVLWDFSEGHAPEATVDPSCVRVIYNALEAVTPHSLPNEESVCRFSKDRQFSEFADVMEPVAAQKSR
jgi:hypothetical protein